VLVAAGVSAALALVAFTVVGDFIVGGVLGVRGEVAEGAREVLGILVFLPFFTGFRGLFQGLVMRERRTALVSFATGVRIVALFAFLAFGSRWFSGPALGAFALLGCVATETLLMAWFASRCTIPRSAEGEKGTWEIIRFAWPLAFSSCLQQSIPLVINAIISRLPDGTLALASFGVVRGFLFLLAGPMRNLQQVYLTLVRNRADYAVLVSFFRRLSAGMAVLMILIAYPLNEAILGRVMGLDAEMRQYIALPLVFCSLFPFLYGAANLLRGYFTGDHLTGLLGWSTVFKLLYLLTCWGVILAFPIPVPGIALAIFLLLSSEFWEFWYLHRKRRSILGA
jgi:progressive ankylosis protein